MEDVASLLTTKKDADRLIYYLEMILRNLYQVKKSVVEIIDESLPFDMKEVLLDLFKHNNISLDNPEQLQQFISQIKQNIIQMPVITLIIAFTPEKVQVEKLMGWFQKNYPSKLLLDLQINEYLIGGVQIQFKGSFKDYSLRKKLESL